jgi:hypothetical protein
MLAGRSMVGVLLQRARLVVQQGSGGRQSAIARFPAPEVDDDGAGLGDAADPGLSGY